MPVHRTNEGGQEKTRNQIIRHYFQCLLRKNPKITKKLEKNREKNFMRKNFYETSIGFERNKKKQLTLIKGYIILKYMKKCDNCNTDKFVGTIFYPTLCIPCIIKLRKK